MRKRISLTLGIYGIFFDMGSVFCLYKKYCIWFTYLFKYIRYKCALVRYGDVNENNKEKFLYLHMSYIDSRLLMILMKKSSCLF